MDIRVTHICFPAFFIWADVICMSNTAKYRRKIAKLISVNCISSKTFSIYFWTWRGHFDILKAPKTALCQRVAKWKFSDKELNWKCGSCDWRHFFHLRKFIKISWEAYRCKELKGLNCDHHAFVYCLFHIMQKKKRKRECLITEIHHFYSHQWITVRVVYNTGMTLLSLLPVHHLKAL